MGKKLATALSLLDMLPSMKDLTPSQAWVLVAYAKHADVDGGNVFPSQETVAAITKFDRRTVGRVTRSLVEKGFLVPEGNVSSRSTNGWTRGYRIPLFDATDDPNESPTERADDPNESPTERTDDPSEKQPVGTLSPAVGTLSPAVGTLSPATISRPSHTSPSSSDEDESLTPFIEAIVTERFEATSAKVVSPERWKHKVRTDSEVITEARVRLERHLRLEAHRDCDRCDGAAVFESDECPGPLTDLELEAAAEELAVRAAEARRQSELNKPFVIAEGKHMFAGVPGQACSRCQRDSDHSCHDNVTQPATVGAAT